MLSMFTFKGQYTRKANRTFTLVRRLAWTVTFLVGVGGQFVPRLGLLVPLLMVAMMGMSLFSGKYWCGNFCPHGSYFDRLVQSVSPEKKVPALLRSRPVVATVLVFFLVNMGRRFFSVYMAMDPAGVLDRTGFIFANTYLLVLLAGTLLGVLISSRSWCQICPMGTLQAGLYKLGKTLGLHRYIDPLVTLAAPEKCLSCGLCSQVCPIQLTPHVEFTPEGTFDHEACIRCQTCVQNCPVQTLTLKKRHDAA